MKNIFYVYAYLNPDKEYDVPHVVDGITFTHEPFYIGYGQRDRCMHHLREALDISAHSHKVHTIRKLQNEGKDPIIVKLREDMESVDALALEGLLVSSFGKRIDGSGCLTNISDGGHVNPVLPGAANPMYGRPLSPESRQKAVTSYKNWWYNKATVEEKAAAQQKRSETFRKYWADPLIKEHMLSTREETKRKRNPEFYVQLEIKKQQKKEAKEQRIKLLEERREAREKKFNLNKCSPEERKQWFKEHYGGSKNPMYGKGDRLAGSKNGRAKIYRVAILNYIFVCHGNVNRFSVEFKNHFSCNNPLTGSSFMKRYNVVVTELDSYDDLSEDYILYEGPQSFERLKHEQFKKCKDR